MKQKAPSVLRRIRNNLCIILALCLSLAPLVSRMLPQTNFYETVQLNTVLVDVPDGWGTGFAIRRINKNGNQRLFVWTARHVVHALTPVSVVIFVRDAEHRRVSSIRLDVKRVWETDADAALLWIDCPAGMFTGIEFDRELPALGSDIFAVGNGDGPVYDGVVTKGIVSQFGIPPNPARGLDWEVIDATTTEFNGGVSGGAVISERTHKVVGIAVGSTHHGMNVYLPTREVLRSAKAAGIEWAVFGAECPTDEELLKKPSANLWRTFFGL